MAGVAAGEEAQGGSIVRELNRASSDARVSRQAISTLGCPNAEELRSGDGKLLCEDLRLVGEDVPRLFQLVEMSVGGDDEAVVLDGRSGDDGIGQLEP